MDLAPLYGLRLRTDRLELRWPTEDEIVALAHLAETGVHDPEVMPFLVPWTDGIGKPGFVEDYAAYHHGLREHWTPAEWSLDLGVWAGGELIGSQGIMGRDFAAKRVLESGSWLAQRFQGRGFGTEMRAAILELGFRGLGALSAASGVIEGNVASLRVSQKLGYVQEGEEWPQIRGVPTRDGRMRLSRDRWIDRERISVRISGLEPCIPLFGLTDPPQPWVVGC